MATEATKNKHSYAFGNFCCLPLCFFINATIEIFTSNFWGDKNINNNNSNVCKL